MVLQVNSNQPDVFVSENQLRFQANCALAFGARSVIWACYCAGWWYNHVLDKQGNKTQQYDKLKRTNAALHGLGEVYMRYRHEQTVFLGGFTEEELSKTGKNAVDAVNTPCFRNLNAQGTKMLAGRMIPDEAGEGEALFVAAADDPYGGTIRTHRLCFESDRAVRAFGAEGELPLERENGRFCVTLDTCQSILLTAE